MTGGYFPNHPREQYAAIPAANFSTLKHMSRSPAHAQAAMHEPSEQTPAMAFGEAVHAAILEPMRFQSQWICTPDFPDGRTKAGKDARAAWAEQNAGKKTISAETAIAIGRMRDALVNHPLAAELVNRRGDCEAAAVWTDSQTGTLVKCLFDKRWERDDGTQVVIDLKTCADASERGFASAVAKYRYDLQAAIYTDGAAHIFGTNKVEFMFIAVEKTPPFGVLIHEMTGDDLTKAWDEYQRYLSRFAECKRTGLWPCYPAKVNKLVLPAYLYASDDETEITIGGEKL
jgi:hypothetical protein